MFSILNEIDDDSPKNTLSVVATSIGSACSVYVLIAITGYLSFGNAVTGNIIGMCTSRRASISRSCFCSLLTELRRSLSSVNHRACRHCGPSNVFISSAAAPLPCLFRCNPSLSPHKVHTSLEFHIASVSIARRSSSSYQ